MTDLLLAVLIGLMVIDVILTAANLSLRLAEREDDVDG